MKKFVLGTLTLFVVFSLFPREIRSSIVFNCQDSAHCELCHVVLRNCFALERANIDECVADEEETLNIAPCLLHSHEKMSSHDIEAFMELKSEDYSNVNKFITMFQEVIQETEDKALRELAGNESSNNEEISDTLKKHIVKLCLYANYHDNYDNAKKHTQGNIDDIEHNLIHTIKNFINSSDYEDRVQKFLGNPALCMKHPSDWVADRAHFEDNHLPSVGVIAEEETELFSSANDNNPDHEEDEACNRNECNRFLDDNECESKIRMLNQGSCQNCWAFSGLTVLQALRCRKGYGFAEPSIKYLTLCKAEYYHNNPKLNACSEGGNISKFLGTLEKVKMLPTSHEIPYDLPMGESKCPAVDVSIPNLWEGVTLKKFVKNNLAFIGYLKFVFYEYAKTNKIEELIHILKDTIIVQGAVFVTMRVGNVLEFDQNGSDIFMHCQMNSTPDHAMTLVGFGNYTKKSGEASSYWIVRNSWGVKWGDEGYFKIDMYGPDGCNGDVLSTAFPLNIDIKGSYIDAPLPRDVASTDLDSKHDVTEFTNKNKQNSTSGSEKPKVTTPEKPKETTPEKPKVTTPEKPKVTTPEKPKVTTPEKPKATTPEKPKATTPEKPKVTTPEKPKATTPEKPKVTTPEKPKATTPEKPKVPQSSKPNTNTKTEEVNPHVPFRGNSKPSATEKPGNQKKPTNPEKQSVKDKIKQFENINNKFA